MHEKIGGRISAGPGHRSCDDRHRLRGFLLQFHGDRQAIQRAIDDTLDELGASEPIRFRTPAETTWLRHGDAVLPAALVKAGFGEFAYRDTAGRSVETAQTWTDENIVAADLPVVGTVRCHENVIAALDSAFTQLSEAGLAYLVESTEVTGCFVPRRIAESLPLSRHSWGIAIDLNVGDNPRGSFSTQDARLVEVMRAAGFAWGGTWLVPDPSHYELISTPDSAG